ncbi:ATP-binding protein [Acidobacteria bacterium AH-259-L09]|nr:ATP-binding protein [Acidobacteria bacterium AH-259-L09]
MGKLDFTHRDIVPIVVGVTILLWFASFPLKLPLNWDDIFFEGIQLAVVLVGYYFVIRLRIKVLAVGWGVFVYALLIDLLDEFSSEPDFPIDTLQKILEICAFITIALGLFFSYKLLQEKVVQSKQVEEALQDSEARFRHLFDEAPVGYHELDSQGYITSVNRTELEMLGYTLEEMLGRAVWEFVVEKEQSREAYEAKIAGTKPPGRAFERTYKCKDGTTVLVLIEDHLLRDSEGRILGMRSTLQDITERKRAEEALAQYAQDLKRSNEDLEQFASVASHDLQEPLRMVTSYLQLLERRYQGKLDSDADEFIHYAVDGATRMHRLIEDLLAYSRLATRSKDFELTDSQAVFKQVVADLRKAIQESNAGVTHDSLPTLMADETQLTHVFQNLIANAIKFRRDRPPEVHIGAERKEGEWLFSVRDNGIGIDPEGAERIFVIFQRLHGRDEYSGSGIGLAICKTIVERHGGRIWVESAPGKGSTFYFTIPG